MRNGHESNRMRERESGLNEDGWQWEYMQDLHQERQNKKDRQRQKEDEKYWQQRHQETEERKFNEWHRRTEEQKIMLDRYNKEQRNMNLLPHIRRNPPQRTIEEIVKTVSDYIYFITILIENKECDLALAMEEVDRILSEIKVGHKEIEKKSPTDERTSELLVDINTNKRILEFLTKKSGPEILELSIEDIHNILS